MSDHEYVRIDADARLAALDYPGTPAPATGVLDGDRYWPGRAAGQLDGRGLVLAVGANAAPAVLAGKLRRAGVSGSVPMVRAEVGGLDIGHSAHVSRGGYVPAAPYAGAGTAMTWALWLTDEQRAAIDATEPNYRCVRLRAADYPIALERGAAPDAYRIYASRWGVLAADGAPLSLRTQTELHARLANIAELAALVPWADARAAVLALTDPGIRDRVRDWFATAGWTVDAGLHREASGG